MNLVNEIKSYKDLNLQHLSKTKKFYEDMDLETAIRMASTGQDYNGRMNSHQYRVGIKKGSTGANKLLEKVDEIRGSVSFVELFDITENIRKMVDRLGDLWSYDTALRIGFNKKIYPKDVYVQRGVVKGVEKLFGNEFNGKRMLPIDAFPKELQILKAYEIENFLCIWGKNKIATIKC